MKDIAKLTKAEMYDLIVAYDAYIKEERERKYDALWFPLTIVEFYETTFKEATAASSKNVIKEKYREFLKDEIVRTSITPSRKDFSTNKLLATAKSIVFENVELTPRDVQLLDNAYKYVVVLTFGNNTYTYASNSKLLPYMLEAEDRQKAMYNVMHCIIGMIDITGYRIGFKIHTEIGAKDYIFYEKFISWIEELGHVTISPGTVGREEL